MPEGHDNYRYHNLLFDFVTFKTNLATVNKSILSPFELIHAFYKTTSTIWSN